MESSLNDTDGLSSGMQVNHSIDIFFNNIEKEFMSKIHDSNYVKFKIIATNVNSTYRTSYVYIHRDKINNQYKYSAEIEYNVIKCCNENTLIYKPNLVADNVISLLNGIYHWLWDSSVCMECFKLIPLCNRLCFSCDSYRIFWEFGVLHQKIINIPVCSICFEPVFHSKLSCGHYFHKTCFIQMNKSNWFNEEDEYQCPLCRNTISNIDQSNYFLFY